MGSSKSGCKSDHGDLKVAYLLTHWDLWRDCAGRLEDHG